MRETANSGDDTESYNSGDNATHTKYTTDDWRRKYRVFQKKTAQSFAHDEF